MQLLNVLKVFLVDLISLSRANCAQPMTFYATLVVTLLGFKAIVAAVAVTFLIYEHVRHRRRHRATGARASSRRRSAYQSTSPSIKHGAPNAGPPRRSGRGSVDGDCYTARAVDCEAIGLNEQRQDSVGSADDVIALPFGSSSAPTSGPGSGSAAAGTPSSSLLSRRGVLGRWFYPSSRAMEYVPASTPRSAGQSALDGSASADGGNNGSGGNDALGHLGGSHSGNRGSTGNGRRGNAGSDGTVAPGSGVPMHRVFRVVFLVLFVAYPTVSLQIFRTFHCVTVDGVAYLVADMRLQCFDGAWAAAAVYAAAMAALYVVGLPVAILVILWRRRATLFGPGSEDTMKHFGFLYAAYGPSAWWWEVEVCELLSVCVIVCDFV